MSRRFLLDTNIVSELVRNPYGRVRMRIDFAGVDNVSVSVITAAELHFGAARSGSPELLSRIATALSLITVEALPVEAAPHYGRARLLLQRRGQPIGANDLWIAAHALATDAVVVTNNVREFVRVDGLTCQNWLAVT